MTPQGVMGAWIAAGLILGVAAGIWTGQMFMAIFIGVGAGIALGAGLSRQASAQRTEASQVDQVPSRVSNEREHLPGDEARED